MVISTNRPPNRPCHPEKSSRFYTAERMRPSRYKFFYLGRSSRLCTDTGHEKGMKCGLPCCPAKNLASSTFLFCARGILPPDCPPPANQSLDGQAPAASISSTSIPQAAKRAAEMAPGRRMRTLVAVSTSIRVEGSPPRGKGWLSST